MTMLLVHDVDETEDGCPFARMFQSTPSDLLTDNIYSQLALAWQPPRYAGHNRVSQAMIKKALGAHFTGNEKKQLAAVAREEMTEALEYNAVDELSRRLSFLHDKQKTRRFSKDAAHIVAQAAARDQAAAPAAAAPATAGSLKHRALSTIKMRRFSKDAALVVAQAAATDEAAAPTAAASATAGSFDAPPYEQWPDSLTDCQLTV